MKAKLIAPAGLRTVSQLGRAERFYQVLRVPAPLAGMSFPHDVPWEAIASEGFQWIVCLTHSTPPYNPSPLRVLRANKFQDLVTGDPPENPAVEAAALRGVVGAVVAELKAGKGVVVHCEGGTGRSGTLIACTLAALGVPPNDVLGYMERVNAARGKGRGWPESEWQREQVSKFVA